MTADEQPDFTPAEPESEAPIPAAGLSEDEQPLVDISLPEEPAPVSVAPPRIVAETPTGGKPPRVPRALESKSFEPEDEAEKIEEAELPLPTLETLASFADSEPQPESEPVSAPDRDEEEEDTSLMPPRKLRLDEWSEAKSEAVTMIEEQPSTPTLAEVSAEIEPAAALDEALPAESPEPPEEETVQAVESIMEESVPAPDEVPAWIASSVEPDAALPAESLESPEEEAVRVIESVSEELAPPPAEEPAEIEPSAALEETFPAESLESPEEEAVQVIESVSEELVPASTEAPAEIEPSAALDAAFPSDNLAPVEKEKAGPGVKPVLEEPAPLAGASEWDDDISPELAAVLFSAQARPAVAPASAQAVVQVVPAARPAIGPEAPPAAAPALPIHLIDPAEARTLPITAMGASSPAPEAALGGKVRYERLEEPYHTDQGQRTREQWKYLKPDYPVLEGRSVKRVDIEEIQFADGSWRWSYERRYSDGSRDRRSVRANTDKTYIERQDEVQPQDPITGKRLRHREFEAMILAGPPPEEKRGLLGRLLDRDDEDVPASQKSWRPATSGESKRARRRGGDAF